MATNTSKRTSRTVREHSETFSNVSGDSYESSFSPLNLSRKQEKEALSALNDRLATYIEKVRSLEAENSRLHVQIREVEVVERKEKENLAARYENKIDDLRKALDRANSDRTRIEYESSSSIAKFNEVKARADKFEKELKRVEKERNYSQSLVSDLQAKIDDSENRRRYAEEKLAELEKDKADLQKRFDTVQGQLQDEVVFRQELQTKYDRLKEDLDFERRTHNNQLEEVRRKRQVEMTTLQAEKESEFNARLRDHLESMRADFDARLASASDQLLDMNERLRQRDEQITALNMEIRERIKSYQDLLQTKIQLDTELQAYHKLLEGEEARLHITPTSTPNTSVNTSNVNTSNQHISFSDVLSSTRRGIKRRRLEVDDQINFDRSSKSYKSNSHAETDVEFEEIDPEGKFVRLVNKGEEEIPIGGWTITVSDNDREVSFKFHSRQVLKGSKAITIWSSDSTETHKPPETIVMKNQKWLTGDFVRAELHNDADQVVAWRENHYSEGFNITSRDDPNERCFIM